MSSVCPNCGQDHILTGCEFPFEPEIRTEGETIFSDGPPIAVIDVWRRPDGRISAIASKSHFEALAIVEGEPVNLEYTDTTVAGALAGLMRLDDLVEG